MDQKVALICGNWGGTTLRAFALDANGVQIGESREGLGINELSREAQEEHWFSLVDEWCRDGSAPHLLCGSVGSNLGWLQTGYVEAPSGLADIADAIETRRIRGMTISVIPGLKTTNRLGEPDTMRSEETEVLGALDWLGAGEARIRLFCLPGTHTKWVSTSDHDITGLSTGLTGETFQALANGTVITRGSRKAGQGDAFDAGVRLGMNRQGGLLQKLYSVRARQLSGALAAEDSESFLSGLIIGEDVGSGMDIIRDLKDPDVFVIANKALAPLYERALTLAGRTPVNISAERASIAGFKAIARHRGSI